ncbi:uncharacterized protein G2W53_042430 [Senna tora]|uniref:Uncharacterized protein n=1 Tax=Senna tora TaxID=362788 RepID=A0A834SGU3_9FABA|nr:uncharacterized protein G2W53_042430 [Senna tora]
MKQKGVGWWNPEKKQEIEKRRKGGGREHLTWRREEDKIGRGKGRLESGEE